MTSVENELGDYGVTLWGQAIRVRRPNRFRDIVEKAFAAFQKAPANSAQIQLEIGERRDGRITIDRTGVKDEKVHMELDAVNLAACLVEAATNAWARAYDSGAVLSAQAVEWRGRGLLLAGPDQAGKTAMSEFLLDKGATYLSDSMVAVDAASKTIWGAPSDLALADAMRRPGAGSPIADASRNAVAPPAELIIFPQMVRDGKLEIEALSTGAAGQRLMQGLKNGASLPREGLSAVADIARSVRAVSVSYGDIWQLVELADRIDDLLEQEPVAPRAGQAVVIAGLDDRENVQPKIAEAISNIAGAPGEIADLPSKEANSKGEGVKLTLGMATYDDYDGVYFTIQALRLYHPEVAARVEFIVVDNNPGGPCGEPLKSLEGWIPNYRYVAEPLRTGTSQSRNRVFEEARGEFVLCMDCHVFIVPGALQRLLAYFDANPGTSDLIQGPLLMDDLKTVSTHFKPEWGAGMYGQWETDPRGVDADAPAFDIPMQGLGLFACRKEAWLGFNAEFRGFGGEEGYIHEKFRQHGRRALCIPFLRWLHRFSRPMGVPYPAPWEDRIRNYLIGYRELGQSSEAMQAHFRELLGAEQAQAIFDQLKMLQTV